MHFSIIEKVQEPNEASFPAACEVKTMPIYEFYCSECHTIFNFFSKTVNTGKKPLCPGCKKVKLDRRMSAFATLRNQTEQEDMPLPDFDEAKMEKAMHFLEKEANPQSYM